MIYMSQRKKQSIIGFLDFRTEDENTWVEMKYRIMQPLSFRSQRAH